LNNGRDLAVSACKMGAVVVQIAGLNHLAQTYLGDITKISGPSMQPTINKSGDLLLYETRSVRNNKLKPGNIVIVKSPKNPKETLCKRLIAMEGETVEIESPYAPGMSSQLFVPKGHVWIQGDNLYNSSDSRSYGPIPRALIIGRAFARIYPFSQAELLKDTLQYKHSKEHLEAKARYDLLIRQKMVLQRTKLSTSLVKAELHSLRAQINALKAEEEHEKLDLYTMTIILNYFADSE